MGTGAGSCSVDGCKKVTGNISWARSANYQFNWHRQGHTGAEEFRQEIQARKGIGKVRS